MSDVCNNIFSPKIFNRKWKVPKLCQMIHFLFYLIWVTDNRSLPSPKLVYPNVTCMAWSHTEILLKRSPFVIFWKLLNRETDFSYLKLHWFKRVDISFKNVCTMVLSSLFYMDFSVAVEACEGDWAVYRIQSRKKSLVEEFWRRR